MEDTVFLNGDGYVELNSSLLPHAAEDEAFQVTFTTTVSNGLLFWQGQSKGTDVFASDFIAIAGKSWSISTTVRADICSTRVLKDLPKCEFCLVCSSKRLRPIQLPNAFVGCESVEGFRPPGE